MLILSQFISFGLTIFYQIEMQKKITLFKKVLNLYF